MTWLFAIGWVVFGLALLTAAVYPLVKLTLQPPLHDSAAIDRDIKSQETAIGNALGHIHLKDRYADAQDPKRDLLTTSDGIEFFSSGRWIDAQIKGCWYRVDRSSAAYFSSWRQFPSGAAPDIDSAIRLKEAWNAYLKRKEWDT